MFDHHHDDHDHAEGGHNHFGDSPPFEQPLDAANQSLADALRASFTILKVIMLVLVVLYVFSNVRTVGSHEEALILRFGRLLPEARDAGLVKAFPVPIDEVVRLPTRKSNEIVVDQSFRRLEGEEGKSLSFIGRGEHQGLDPSTDVALLTADSGLVHVKWKVTYKIDRVVDFVRNFAGDQVEAAERILRPLVETTAVHLAAEMTAGELIRTRLAEVQENMKINVNRRLTELKTGINVTLVEMFEPTPPLQIRGVFDNTLRAENAKQQRIQNAEQQRIKVLSEAAGARYQQLIDMLDRLEAPGLDPEKRLDLRAELGRFLENEVEGKAGRLIKDAGSYHSNVVSGIQNDLAEYRTLLPEYERNPSLLFARLWESTRAQVFDDPGVTKIHRPQGLKEFRLIIPLDPEQTRQEEELRIRKRDLDAPKLRPQEYHPAGPENE